MMAVVVICGVVIGCKQSGTRSQLRATVLAFAALAAVIIAFCGIVIVASQRWAAPACAVASIIVPLVVYLVAMAIPAHQHNRETVVAQGARRSVSRDSSGSKPTREARQPVSEFTPINSASAPKLHLEEAPLSDWDAPGFAEQEGEFDYAEELEFEQAAEPEQEQESNLEPESEPESEIELEIEPEPELIFDTEAAIEVEPEFSIDGEYDFEVESESESDLGPKIEPESESEPEDVSEFEQAVEPEPEPESELEVASEFEQATEPEPELEPELASEPKSAPAPEQDVAAERPLEPTVFDPSRYFDKATSLRNKGLFEVAAQLYAECAELAEDRATFRKATIEQIACYVKSDKLDEAQTLAAALKENAPDLTAVENMKVDAVLRMGER